MSYLLDTSTCITHLRAKSTAVTEGIKRGLPDVFICSLVKGELLFGAMRSAKPDENLKKAQELFSLLPSLPFDDEAAEAYAGIRRHLADRGMLIGPNDLLIASVALSRRLTLVTHNTSEFSRVPGLVVEDWG